MNVHTACRSLDGRTGFGGLLRRAGVRFATLTVVIAFASVSAPGQSGYSAPSLEWLVLQADLVVRGSIVRIGPAESHEERNWAPLKVKVHETLKGEPIESVAFALDFRTTFPEIYKDWKETGVEQLWFLVQNEHYQRTEDIADGGIQARYPFRMYRDEGIGVLQLKPSTPEEQRDWFSLRPIFSTNLTLLVEPEDILRAARKAVAAEDPAARDKKHLLYLPIHIMMRSGGVGDANVLVVPVDARLEPVARALINSPEDLLPKEDVVHAFNPLRGAGVDALRYFPSEPNIVLLRGLLDDEATAIRRRGGQPPERFYIIREKAQTVLEKWGVEVQPR